MDVSAKAIQPEALSLAEREADYSGFAGAERASFVRRFVRDYLAESAQDARDEGELLRESYFY